MVIFIRILKLVYFGFNKFVFIIYYGFFCVVGVGDIVIKGFLFWKGLGRRMWISREGGVGLGVEGYGGEIVYFRGFGGWCRWGWCRGAGGEGKVF